MGRAAAPSSPAAGPTLALIDDRDDCFVVGEVNQQALFCRVAALVHHGGTGTTTTAARAGAPQVVVPQMADQPYLAGRVADLGVGAAHDGPTPTTESLSAALRTALTPENPCTSGRRGRHGPHRQSNGGRDDAARQTQPRKAAGVRVNHASPTSYAPASNSTGWVVPLGRQQMTALVQGIVPPSSSFTASSDFEACH